MPYSPEIVARARARLASAKEAQERENQAREEAAYAAYPRLREIKLEIARTMTHALGESLKRRAPGEPSPLVAARKTVEELKREQAWILEASELDEGVLDHQPICQKCGGEGYIGAQMCECLAELCRQEQKKSLSSLLGTGRESFDNFRLDYYPDDYYPSLGASPRQLMETVLRRCRTYARQFSPKSPSLLFSGGTGLGKTFLSGCIARAVSDAGFSVVYDTAVQLIEDFQAEQFRDETGRTERYSLCDLLIIDDLGTEMNNQFTQSALYRVVNARLVAGRQTIISTNLSTKNISERYQPQLVSRLLGAYELMLFFGDDIRMRGKT